MEKERQDAPGPDVRVKYRIMGVVQGVGMRAWMQAEAASNGLNGWVRNEADGSVTALFIGAGASVANLAELLAQGSPASSVVDICELALDNYDLNWDATIGFSIRSDY